MSVKTLLAAALGGAILVPLAVSAYGPVAMKPPPEPHWRQLPRPAVPASDSYGGAWSEAPPQDLSPTLGPPSWIYSRAPSWARRFGADALPEDLPPRYVVVHDEPPAPLPEYRPEWEDKLDAGLPEDRFGIDSSGVTVHRMAQEAARVARRVEAERAAANEQPAEPAYETPEDASDEMVTVL